MSLVFLAIEGRRYRYFDIWRTRVRLMEVSMFVPLLRLEGVRVDNRWNEELAKDYERLQFHITFGRRLDAGCDATIRFFLRSRLLAISPKSASIRLRSRHSTSSGSTRRSVRLPGQIVLIFGFLFHASLVALIAVLTLKGQRAAGRVESMPAKYV